MTGLLLRRGPVATPHGVVVVDGYLLLPGGSGNYVDTPDHADFDITGDIDIQVELSMTDWTPGANSVVVGKWTTSQLAYRLIVLTDGKLFLAWHTGAASLSAQSSVTTGFTNGARQWIRATMDVDNGSSQRVIKFYTAPAAASPIWTQLGSTVTTAGATSIANTNATVTLGSDFAGASDVLTGKLYRLNLRNGFDGAGTLKSAVDLTGFVGAGSTYTDPEGHVWTERGTANFVAAA